MAGKVKHLEIHTTQGRAGDLERASQFVTSYTREAAASRALGISLTMPARLAPYAANTIPPVLAMNLPEGFLLDLVHARYQKVMNVRDPMNLLALTSTPTSGRVWTRSPDNAGEAKATGEAVALKEILAARGTEELFAQLVERFALATSISGVMPKVAIPEKSKVNTPGLIVKAGAAEYPGIAQNEFICMSIAKAAGIDVPAFWLSDDGNLFVVRRFDIAPDGGYLGFEDMASLTGRVPEAKYEGSYRNIARAIADFTAPAHRAESLERFFRQLVLCVLLRNGDAHLKNWGLVYANPETAAIDARLSPAFDLVCTQPYIPGDVLALGLAGTKAWPARAALEQFGREDCALAKPGEAIDRLRDTIMEFRPREKSAAWKLVRSQMEASCAALGPGVSVGPRHPRRRSRG